MLKLSVLKELGISVVRTTIVPWLAAIIIQMLFNMNIEVEDKYVISALTFILSAAWYVVFRWIELATKDPFVQKWAGILLGFPRKDVPVNPDA